MSKNKTKKLPSRIEKTAYHEAGHAVVAIFLRIPVCKISIVPAIEGEGENIQRTLGRLIHNSSLASWVKKKHEELSPGQGKLTTGSTDKCLSKADEERMTKRLHRLVRGEVRVYVAGYVAQAVLKRKSPSFREFTGSREDWKYANGLAMLLSDNDAKRAEELVMSCFGSDVKLFFRPEKWRAVQKIANELLKRLEISGKEARRLYLDAIKE